MSRLPRGTGSVSRSGKRWKASPRVNGVNTYIGTFDTREEAERAVLDHIASPSRPAKPMTLNAWGTKWMRQRAHDGIHRCSEDERLIWETRIEGSFLGPMPLSSITAVHVRDWIRQQVARKNKRTGRPHARQTICNAFNTLRVCLRDAVEEGLIDSNPARELRVPKIPRTTEGWSHLNERDMLKLCSAHDPTDTNYNAILFALFTGMRSGEIWSLRWDHVDMEQRVITVATSLGGPTKSGRVRRIPMLSAAHSVLQHQHAISGKGRLVFPSRLGSMRGGGNDAQLRKYLERLDIKRIRFHDLRHACAIHLVSGTWGRVWSLMEVRDMLGHTSIQTTQRYARFVEGGIFRAGRDTVFQHGADSGLGALVRVDEGTHAQ